MSQVISKIAGSPAEGAMLADASLDVAWPLIEYFTTLVRESGSAAERQAFEYVCRQLEALGVPYQRFEPELYLSVPIEAYAEVDGQRIAAKAQAFSANTPPKGVTGEMIYVPADSPDDTQTYTDVGYGPSRYDVRGKIVLTEGLANPEACLDFEQRGAIAQLHINPGQRSHWGIATTVWGMPDLDSMANIPNTSVLAINRPDGDALIARVRAGRGRVTVHSLSDQRWKRVPLVVAEIRGSDEPEKFVLAHGHLHARVGPRLLAQPRQPAPQYPDRLVARALDRALRRLNLVRRHLRAGSGRELYCPGRH
jgi:N-acetylated-alpha-linked acidic dipeptidase